MLPVIRRLADIVHLIDSEVAQHQAAFMGAHWLAIVDNIRSKRGDDSANLFYRALGGIEELSQSIADGPLGSMLFGWVSMFDLCIQQTDAAPYSASYLRISPLDSGMVEFRYIDTHIAVRQWYREVPPDAVIPRLNAFLEELRWVAMPGK